MSALFKGRCLYIVADEFFFAKNYDMKYLATCLVLGTLFLSSCEPTGTYSCSCSLTGPSGTSQEEYGFSIEGATETQADEFCNQFNGDVKEDLWTQESLDVSNCSPVKM
jgi:hypothetical protein